MIIKSMSRKQASFGQLLDYMEDGRQDKYYTIKHNLYKNNKEQVQKEFEHNASFFHKRKNGVYMYHEVLSITKSDKITDEKQKQFLYEIAHEYIKKRSINNLVYAVLHDDKENNLHYHFMISSNELENEKKHRLSKLEFDKVKKNLENYVIEKYPELEQEKVINKPAKEKKSNNGAELKRRTGKIPQRDSVKNRLETVFEKSKDKLSFFNNMEKEKLSIYVRGKTIGVIDKETGRNHRLKTLGMLDQFNKVSAIIEAPKQDKKTDNNREEPREKRKEKNKESSKKETQREKIINSRKDEIKNSRDRSSKNNDSSKSFNR